jgi:STE24 endopeptidase
VPASAAHTTKEAAMIHAAARPACRLATALSLILAVLVAVPAFAQAPPVAAPGGTAVRADSAATDSTAVVATAPATPHDYIAEIRANFTPESRAYSRVRGVLSLADPLVGILLSLIILATGLSARMRDIAHAMGSRRYVRVLVYVTLYSLLSFVLGFPLAWYEGFALEHQFGLSNQSFGGWVGEEFIGLVVSIVTIGVIPLAALAYSALEKSPKRWWLWLACGMLPVIIAAILVGPYVEMLTNKFQPLRDQQLKSQIVALAEKAGIPGRNVYEVDRSKQTKKVNAYVNGFGPSQRIVLWDTTLQQMKTDEILFVMGHEMGHYVLGHTWKLIGMVTVLSFGLFWLASVILNPLVARWGPRWGFSALHDLAAMPLLAAVLTVVSFIAQPITNGYSRVVEHESDIYGLEITHSNDAAARAFIKLGAQNRSDPEPPAWRVWLQYSHPPLIERVRFATAYRPWERGEKPKLFLGKAEKR